MSTTSAQQIRAAAAVQGQGQAQQQQQYQQQQQQQQRVAQPTQQLPKSQANGVPQGSALPASATAAQPGVVYSPAVQALRNLCEQVVLPSTDIKTRIKIVKQIRYMEAMQSDEITHQLYVPTVAPTLLNILRKGVPTMDSASDVHELRRIVLEMIYRLPTVEILRNYLKDILELIIYLLDVENEPNVLLCLKIINEKCSSFRPALPALIQKFLHYVQSMFSNFPKMLQTMQSLDSGSQAQIRTQLSVQIQDLNGQVARYSHALTTARDQYSLLHGQYQTLQGDAKKMTEEQTKLSDQIGQVSALSMSGGTLPQGSLVGAAGATPMQVQGGAAPAAAGAVGGVGAAAGMMTAAGAGGISAAAAGLAPQLQQNQLAVLSAQHATSVRHLNGNIKQQQAVHSQLKAAQQKYAEAQAGQQKADMLRTELKNQLAQVEAQQAAIAQAKPGESPLLPLLRGAMSFKVLSECRNIVIRVFQLYKDLVRESVQGLVPHMIAALRSTLPASITATPQVRELYASFIACQVKTLWFLTYCMNRGYAELIKPYGDTLPGCVIFLLGASPPEAASVRKELLIATRHILASDLRGGFVQHLDSLMDERMLVGTGWSAKEMLRPLAYSTLADLLHHVRDKLTMPQLQRAVNLFLRNILDESLPLQIQTMSCKLLLNLVQILAPKTEPLGASRELLMCILHTFVTKLETLATHKIPRVLRYAKEAAKNEKAEAAAKQDAASAVAGSADAGADAGGGNAMETTAKAAGGGGGAAAAAGGGADHEPKKLPKWLKYVQKRADGSSEEYSIDPSMWVPLTVQQISDSHVDLIKDTRFLLKNLVNGLKTILWGIHTGDLAAANATSQQRPQRLLRDHETYLLHDLLKHGLNCFKIYEVGMDDKLRPLSGVDVAIKPTHEEKETIDNFANVFATLDPACFREVFQVNLPHVVEEITDNNLLLTIAQHVLSQSAVSNFFAGSLLKYLMSRLDALGQPDRNTSNVLLRLFKLVFGSVNLYAEANEMVLQPHLSDIINRSVDLATTAEEPENYFLLLRALFRSIGGGKFEALYKEFLPLLPSLLNGLNRLKDGTHTQQLKDLLIELCLTVPVRLSALLPYLHYLMRPLVLALKSNTELVSQGLRTLELCIDNLSPEFLSPIIEPVRPELMGSLWHHLKPATVKDPRPPRHGATTLRLLGKLGGRNRCAFKSPPVLTPRSHKGPALRLALTYDRDNEENRGQGSVVNLAIDEGVAVAMEILTKENDNDHRMEAFTFLKAALVGMFNLEPSPDGSPLFNPTAAADRVEANAEVKRARYVPPKSRKGDGRDVLQTIASGIFIAAGRKETKEAAIPFLKNIVRHAILLSIVKSSQPANKPVPRSLDPEVIICALVECLGSNDTATVAAAEPMLAECFEVAVKLLGSAETASKLVMFDALTFEICASVYELEWFKKKAGCIGIQFLMRHMPKEWLMAHLLKFAKVLLFATMDLTNQIGCGVVELACGLMTELVETCFATGPYDLVKAAVSGAGGAAAAAAAAAAASAATDAEGDATMTDGGKVPPAAGFEGGAATAGAGQQLKTNTDLGKLVIHLVSELLSPDDNVRGQVKKALVQLARLSGLTLPELVKHTGLKKHMVPKTLRNCPISVQVGRMDAMTFCLRMVPPLLSFLPTEMSAAGQANNNNSSYVKELLELCKLDETRTRVVLRPGNHVTKLTMVSLRARALDLVGAITLEDAWAEERKPVVEQFIRALLSPHDEVVDVACAGLKLLKQKSALPAALLTTAIRPLLDNFSDYSKLNVPTLNSISRLLDILPIAAFNQTFAEKLYEYLELWLQDVRDDITNAQNIHQGKRSVEATKVACAIVEVFPKLDPQQSVKYLERVIDTILKTEDRIGRLIGSPFRPSLSAYADYCAQLTVSTLLRKSSLPSHMRFFIDLLRNPECKKIHGVVLEKPEEHLITNIFTPGEVMVQKAGAYPKDLQAQALLYTGVEVVNVLCEYDAQLMVRCPTLLNKVLDLWSAPSFLARLQSSTNLLPLKRITEPRMLVEALMQYSQTNQDNVDVIFRLLSILWTRTLMSNTFLKEFFYTIVSAKYPIATQKQCMLRLIDSFQRAELGVSINDKIEAFNMLCIPMTTCALINGNLMELLGAGTDGTLSQFVTKVLTPSLGMISFDETLQIAVLQFCMTLITAAREVPAFKAEFTESLKVQLLNFAWQVAQPGLGKEKVSDPMIKHAASILVCELFVNFKMAVNNQSKVLVLNKSLLEEPAGEHAKLSERAINLLQPLLPVFAPPEANGMPAWVSIIIDALENDTQSQGQVQHVWMVVAEHSEIYYPYRNVMIPWLVQSLSRNMSQSSSQVDNRRLSIAIATLLVTWEIEAIDNALVAESSDSSSSSASAGTSVAPSADGSSVPSSTVGVVTTASSSMDTAADPIAAAAGGGGGGAAGAAAPAVAKIDLVTPFRMTNKMREIIVNFLIVSACSAMDPQTGGAESASLSDKCIALLEKILVPSLWLSTSFSIGRFDKLLQQATVEVQSNHPYRNYVSALRILRVVLRMLPLEQGLAQICKIRHGMLRASQCQQLDVSGAFGRLFGELLERYPISRQQGQVPKPELDQLYRHLHQQISVALDNFALSQTTPGLALLRKQLSLLEIICEANRGNLEPFIGILMKLVQKLTKEHLIFSSQPPHGHQAAVDQMAAVEQLNKALALVAETVFAPNHPHRKIFLASGGILQSLVDKTTNPAVLEAIAKIIGNSILRSPTMPPGHSTKEKSALFNRVMLVYTRRFPNHPKLSTVYNLVLSIFRDPNLANSDISMKLEAAFMLGLRAQSTEIREQFFELHDSPNRGASLHGRLDYCFNDKYQRWETSRHAFWVKHCLDTVLAGASGSIPICPAIGVYRLPPLMVRPQPRIAKEAAAAATATAATTGGGAAVAAGAAAATAAVTAPKRAKIPPAEAHAIFKEHEQFLLTLRHITTRSVVLPLRSMCSVSPDLAYQMWVGLFPLLWHVLETEARESVGACLQMLLACEYHTDQAHVRPNNIHAILTGIARCIHPRPDPPPSLLYHLAKTHNLWHTGIAMLRNQGLKAENRGEKITDGKIDPIQDAMGDLYQHLGEVDTWFGLWRLRAKLSKSAKALAFEQQGYWEQAQRHYEEAMLTAVQHGIRDAEFRLWEHHWILCGERLGQHDLLVKYGDESKNHDVILKSAWKLKSWKKLKDMVKRLMVQREPSYTLQIAHAFSVIGTSDEQNLLVVEKAKNDAVTLSLQAWASLPTIVSHSHTPILEGAQQIVELVESSQLCHAMHPSKPMGRISQDLNSLVELWRKRLPNEWDEIEVWQDVLQWRLLIFDKIAAVNKTVGTKNEAIQFAQNEMAWTINQLAKVARQHRMKDVCEKTLGMMYKFQAVDPSDLFDKARESVMCHMQLTLKPKDTDLQAQLTIINGTNLQYFKAKQNAEFFALKGTVLHKLGKWKDANKSFSTAVSLCDDLGMAWEAWAVYCDDMFQKVRDSVKQLKAQEPAAKKAKSNNASTEANAREWGKSAITCYLNACRSYTDDEKSKKVIARSLTMLTMDDEMGEIGMTFGRLAEGIDASIWRFWIPQLITSLSRPEAKYVHGILVRLAKYYPQAIYCSLRTAFLEIRASENQVLKNMQRRKAQAEAQAKAGGSTAAAATATATGDAASPQAGAKRSATDAASPKASDASGKKRKGSASSATSPTSGGGVVGDDAAAAAAGSERAPLALQHVHHIMQTLRTKHSMLAGTMEHVIEQIVERFKPYQEEEILRTIRVLLTECLKFSFAALDRSQHPGSQPASENVPVPMQVQVHLSRMLSSFLTPQNPAVLHHREKFEKDFGNVKQITLDQCLRKLREWHVMMSGIVAQLPKSQRLEDLSPFLTNFPSAHAEIDLPGEHVHKHLMNQAAHSFVRIERFLPDVQVVYSHSSASRRLMIRGRDGKVYPYLVKQAPTRHARTEERFLQMFRIVNTLLDKRKESRKRSLGYHVPRMVPLNTHVQLYQDDTSSLSLEDVFEEFCKSSNITVDKPIMDCYESRRKFQERDLQSRREHGKPLRDIRKDIFDSIRRQHVPSDILNRFMRATFPDHSELWMFQRQFSVEIAMMAFATHVFMMNKGAPHTMKFMLTTGNIVSWDMMVTYNSKGEIVVPEPIPFRLTPNLVNFVTPVGITGLFSAALIASAQTLNDPEFRIKDYLSAILRDEIISWHALTHEPWLMSAMPNSQLLETVEKNANNMKTKLEELAEFDGTNSNVDALIKNATTSQNLCLMSPTWHPWL